MMSHLRIFIAAALTCAAPAASTEAKADASKKEPDDVVLDGTGAWRAYAVLRPPVLEKGGKVLTLSEFIATGGEVWRKSPHDQPVTAPPPSGWTKPDFDDVSWGLSGDWIFRCREKDRTSRRRADYYYRSRFGMGQPVSLAMLCCRGCFELKDPGAVKNLRLRVDYRGGVLVHLNGKEVSRGHLPEGDLTAGTSAESYPQEVHVDKKGKPLGGTIRKTFFNKTTLPKLEKRVRTLECDLSAGSLRKGTNVLALQVHRAPIVEQLARGGGWSSAGLVSMTLTSPEAAAFGGGKTPGDDAPVWNASVVAGVRERDKAPVYGKLRPIRIVGTRNGTFSGQVVAGCGVEKAKMTALEREGGNGAIPDSAVRVRYALPRRFGCGVDLDKVMRTDRHAMKQDRFDILSKVPYHRLPDAVKKLSDPPALQPVWVTVKIPADAAPGEYRGELSIVTKGKGTVRVPVELHVGEFVLPDPPDYVTHVGIIQSPESLSVRYGVPPYSEKHWELIERSWKLLSDLGNDVVYIPVICRSHFGNKQGMVRWVKKPDGTYDHDWSLAERYLDIVLKSGAKPTVVCLYVWDYYCTAGGADKAKMKKAVKRSVPLVNVADPASGGVKDMEAPDYGDPAANAFWKPVAQGFMSLLKKKGLEKAGMIGVAGDLRPSKDGAMKVWSEVLPGAPWVMHSHQGQLHRKGYSSFVYHLRYPADPAIERQYGWRRGPCTQVSNLHRCWRGSSATHVHGRLMPELVVTGGAQGIGRIRGDLWSIVERFLMNNYGQLSLDFGTGYEFLQPGPDGPVPTVTGEVFREGIQETEARTFIEKALTDEAARKKLGGELSGKCRDVLDTRLRYMLWTGLYGHGNTWGENVRWKAGSPESGKITKMGSRGLGAGPAVWGGMGHDWYDTTGWQDRSKELFEAAAEVAKALEK